MPWLLFEVWSCAERSCGLRDPELVLNQHREPEVEMRKRRHRGEEPEHVVRAIAVLGIDINQVFGIVPDVKEVAVEVGVEQVLGAKVTEADEVIGPLVLRKQLVADDRGDGSVQERRAGLRH